MALSEEFVCSGRLRLSPCQWQLNDNWSFAMDRLEMPVSHEELGQSQIMARMGPSGSRSPMPEHPPISLDFYRHSSDCLGKSQLQGNEQDRKQTLTSTFW